MTTATETMTAELRETLAADGLMSIDEAVRFSRTSRAHVYRLMRASLLAYVHMGRRRLVVRKSLTDLIAREMIFGQPHAEEANGGR